MVNSTDLKSLLREYILFDRAACIQQWSHRVLYCLRELPVLYAIEMTRTSQTQQSMQNHIQLLLTTGHH